MGHTHHYYVERAYGADAFARAANDFRSLLSALKRHGVDLAGAVGTGEPAIGPRLIKFNGAGGSACEPFRLERAAGGWHMRPVGRVPVSAIRTPENSKQTRLPSSESTAFTPRRSTGRTVWPSWCA